MLWSADYLKTNGVPSARLDAEYILAHVLGVGRLEMYLQHERPLTARELDDFRPLLKRRAKREPLQYVLGRQAFRSLDLEVRPGVLIPRPETESLVEEVLTWARACGRTDLVGLDVGTGSPCSPPVLLTPSRSAPPWRRTRIVSGGSMSGKRCSDEQERSRRAAAGRPPE